jgi:Zn-finger nucleic acid-binding protein
VNLAVVACGHSVCRKLAGCAWEPQVQPVEIRTGNCPQCGVWLQNGEVGHQRVVHPQCGGTPRRKT